MKGQGLGLGLPYQQQAKGMVGSELRETVQPQWSLRMGWLVVS
jgi:hypothetical protein